MGHSVWVTICGWRCE